METGAVSYTHLDVYKRQVVCYVLAIGIYQLACPSQTDWLVSSVEGRVRGDYYSVREMFFMLTYTGADWLISLEKRGINLPLILRQEALDLL